MPKFTKNKNPMSTKIRNANFAKILFDSKNSVLASTALFDENSLSVSFTEPAALDIPSPAEFNALEIVCPAALTFSVIVSDSFAPDEVDETDASVKLIIYFVIVLYSLI